MTIRPGHDWGRPTVVPADVDVVSGDVALAQSPRPVCLAGGDVFRSLGQPVVKTPGTQATLLEVDLLSVHIEDGARHERTLSAASSVTVGRWWSRRRFIVVTNPGWLGSLQVAPKAHPNDGEFDVFEMDPVVDVRERFIARRRARTGSHLPHPGMSLRRFSSLRILRRGRESLRVDGVRIDSWTAVDVVVVPDAVRILV